MELSEYKAKKTRSLSDGMFAFCLIAPAAIVVVFVVIYPLINALYTSFFRYFLTDARGMEFVGLKNYVKMFSSGSFWRAFLHTIEYVGGVVVVESIVALILALLVNFKFSGNNFITTLFFVPWIIPSVVVALISKFLFLDHYNGIVNVVLKGLGIIREFQPWLKEPNLAMGSLVITTVWKMFPFMFVMFYAGLQAVPSQEIEAAKIDGANGVQRFFRVILPNMREIITLATILDFIWMFQYLTVIWTTTKGGPVDRTTTLPIMIYRVAFKGSMNMGYSSALGLFWLVFLFCFSLIYIRVVGKREDWR